MSGEITLFPLANYANGQRLVGPRNIPGVINTITFAVARCTTADPTLWPNQSTTIGVDIEVSADGGTTWTSIGGGTAEGGIAPGRFGGEAVETSFVAQFPGAQNLDARMTLTVAGGPLRSQGTLRWT